MCIRDRGEEYGTIVRKGFAERWIDVFPNKGKSGGAYSGGSYDSNPYICLLYTSKLKAVCRSRQLSDGKQAAHIRGFAGASFLLSLIHI